MKCIVFCSRILLIFIFTTLFLVSCSPDEREGDAPAQALRIQSYQNNVTVKQGENKEKSIIPGENPIDLVVDDQITVSNLGHAQLAISDFLIIDLFRDGELQVKKAILDDQTLLVELVKGTGTIFSTLNVESNLIIKEAINARLDIDTEYSTITVVGTRFLVVKEEHTPLEWVVALEAGESDLFVTAEGSSINIPTGKAVWVAPEGVPGPLIDANVPSVLRWINAARGGVLQPELGEVVWAAANFGVTASQFPEPLPTGGSFKVHEITVQLDPAGSYERLDCNGDGVLDLYAANGRFRFDLRQVIGQKRAIDVKVTNGNPNLDIVLTGFNPANESITTALSTANNAAGSAETFSLRSQLQPYHFAELIIDDGCFIGIDILPPNEVIPLPTTIPVPSTPIATQTATPIPICVPNPPAGWVLHSVIAGETMYNMAVRTGTSIATIKQVNCYFSDAIYVGQLLWLPFNPPTITPTTTPPTITPTNTSTSIPTATPTNTSTNTSTNTPTATPTNTPVTPIPGPSCSLSSASINSNETVRITAMDVPPAQIFNVTMASSNSQELPAYLIGTFNSGDGGDLALNLNIPEILREILGIIIRVQAVEGGADCGSTSFTNNTSNTSPVLDLTISSEEISISSVECPEGQGSCTISVDFIVRNNGPDSYEGILSYQVTLNPGEHYIGSTPVQKEVFVSISGFGFAEASFSSTPADNCFNPDCTVEILVDSNQAIVESNEANNSASRMFDG